MQIYHYIYTCIYMQNGSQRHNDKGRAKTPLENMHLSLYCKVSKKVTQGFTVRGTWRPNITAIYINPHSYGCQRCVFLVLQGCSIGGPGAHSAGFLYHIVSATSLDPNSSEPQGPPPPGFLYHISSITPSDL